MDTQNSLPVPQNVSPQPSQTPVQQSRFPKTLIIVAIVILIVLIGAGGYVLGVSKINLFNKQKNVSYTTTVKTTKGALFSGHIQKLTQNLGLLLTDTNMNYIPTPGNNNPLPTPNVVQDPDAVYYSAGTYMNGKYKGYTRYIAISGISGPGGPGISIFASKDEKSYVLNGNPADAKDMSSNNSLFNIDKTKISTIDHLPSEQPQTIFLNSYFDLVQNGVATQTTANYTGVLQTDFPGATSLPSSQAGLSFYAVPSGNSFIYASSQPSPTPEPYASYIAGTTGVDVADSTGFAYSYYLASAPLVKAYATQLSDYIKAQAAYDKATTEYHQTYSQAKSKEAQADGTYGKALNDAEDQANAAEMKLLAVPETTADATAAQGKVASAAYDQIYNPLASQAEAVHTQAIAQAEAVATQAQNTWNALTSPLAPDSPSLELQSKDITTSDPMYTSYNIAIPENCAEGLQTLVAKGISDTDLQKIGTSTEGDIYVLTSKNNPLYQAEYADKVTSDYNLMNPGSTPPTFAQYVAKNPLIFIKDFWGRWIILGEYELQLEGGCGKPVIYLYPPKPTKVNIQFQTPITFNVDIPTYQNGWNILAQPDGTLTDLQPQFTNCSTIDSLKFGSEYAQSACQKNAYPYLYWAGSSPERNYPAITRGWVIAKADVSTFLNQTLNSIGFTAKEKSDFISYWVPQMMSYSAPYYRISFLQNNEMDEIAPMKVTPNPIHYYRYFLDYLPLTEKPTTPMQPETLTKIVRDGFILVEWGGHLL